MEITFDPGKDASNQADHGISLAAAKNFDFVTALQEADDRRDYGEERTIALGYIGTRLYVLVYTMRGEALRPISLRKANKRECKDYEKTL